MAEAAPSASPALSAPRLYRTLFVGTLVQESALSVGGNQRHGGFDDVLCRDGRNRPTLRGEGLAGALLRTARTLYQESDLADITADKAGGTDRNGSLWAFGNAHPHADPIPDAGTASVFGKTPARRRTPSPSMSRPCRAEPNGPSGWK
jgi:hypothetical protein